MAAKRSFLPPDTNPNHILREEIVGEIKKSVLHKCFFCISAPAGYGKTVLASQFMSRVRGEKAWISISSEDNNHTFYYRRILQALYQIVPDKPFRNAVRGISDFSLDTVLSVISKLPKTGKRCYLVIDDFHLIKSKEILSHLPLLISHVPASYVSIGFLTRQSPPRIDNMIILSKKQLTFGHDEIALLCDQKSITLSSEQIEHISQATSGWAMGITTMILNEANSSFKVSEFIPLELNRYLRQKVWDTWDKAVRDFLMKCSFTAELTAELCVRLTGQKNADEILKNLYEDNFFLSKSEDSYYRFHDLFRKFLNEIAEIQLGISEIRRLKNIAANWFFEKHDYLSSATLFIANRNHDGINKCLKKMNEFSSDYSVEAEFLFSSMHILEIDQDFLVENPYLLSTRTWNAFLAGDSKGFKKYFDIMIESVNSLAEQYPDLIETSMFMSSLYFYQPLKEIACKLLEILTKINLPLESKGSDKADKIVYATTITHNLPLFHRSMRDYSEYHEFNESDFEILRKTFGRIIGRDYNTMEYCLKAGICYEKNDLLSACHFALCAYHLLDKYMHPETTLSVYSILYYIMTALGSTRKADELFSKILLHVNNGNAYVLRPNVKALDTIRKIDMGAIACAQDWLEINASGIDSQRLSFFEICKHFTTLRCLTALDLYDKACQFGEKLYKLASDYNRPLDQIESRILTAIAYIHAGKTKKALKLLGEAVTIALPYGFTRQFINEGKHIFSCLIVLKKKQNSKFLNKIIEEIAQEYSFGLSENEKQFMLSPRQKDILLCLSKSMAYNEIAQEIGLSYGTVKNYVSTIYKKLNVNNIEDALLKAELLDIL